MHPECCWQRATGTRTTQRGKAASRPPEAASSSRLSSRCPVSPPPERPHLGVSRLIRLKGHALSPCPLALSLDLCPASPVRPVSLKLLQEDTGPGGARGTGVGPDKELEDSARLRTQEDDSLVAPGAGAHVHGHSRQLVPGARVGQRSGCLPAPWGPGRTQRHHPRPARWTWAWLQGGTSWRETHPQTQLLPGPACLSPCLPPSFCVRWSLSSSLCFSLFLGIPGASCPAVLSVRLPPRVRSWPCASLLSHHPGQGSPSHPARPPGPRPRVGTDRIRVRTIQGVWPSEGTASSIRGCVLTKLRISSGKALEALYCMPGAAQHPGLGGDEGVVRVDMEAPTQGL